MEHTSQNNSQACASTNVKAGYGINIENLSPSIRPSEDFYEYANAGWMKRHPLPEEYARYGVFDLLRDQAKEQLTELITSLSDSPESKQKDTIAQKIGDLYALGMDSERRNREGAGPIMPLINKIENSSPDDFTSLISWMHKGPGAPFFGTGVGADYEDSDINIMHIGEVGLGLGDRDYYLEKSERNDKILHSYELYIKRIMELIGKDEKEQERIWDNLISSEKKFAEHKMTKEDKRDPRNTYHIMSMDDIRNNYPNVDWDKYFEGIGVRVPDKANVISPDYMSFLNNYIPSLSWREIQDLFLVEIVQASVGVLSDDFEEAAFELYDRTISGIQEMEPRWKRVMTIPNSMFGEAVGQLYVQKHFSEESKIHVKELVENLRTALGEHIKSLSWMSEPTKEKALEKLAALKVKIGYPDKWKDYEELHIDPSLSYQENVLKASEWFTADNYSKLGKPVDKEKWHMYPQTVNAYYSPIANEICFPAAILQPPYFDMQADDALNYGAIGVVIGHEMTHGFDDSGRKFDKNGNMSDWWAPEDDEKFTLLANRLVDQFNKVEVAPGISCNGRFTLGENIADQGGLRVAYTAYRNSQKGKIPTVIDGLTPEQRFYISYANVWADNIREEEKLARTQSDPHSLGRNRVNVTLPNLDEFIGAFQIGPGDIMWRDPEDRIIIW